MYQVCTDAFMLQFFLMTKLKNPTCHTSQIKTEAALNQNEGRMVSRIMQEVLCLPQKNQQRW